MSDTTATPTAAPAVEPTVTPPKQPVAAPVQAAPQQTQVDAKPAEPVKARSLLDEPEKKPVEAPKPAESAQDKAPEKYAPFKMPEGATLSPELSDAFSDLAKAANLPQAKAQEFLDRMTGAMAKQNEASIAEWVNKAADITRADEGDAFEASRAQVARATKLYGDEAFAAWLETPLGKLTVNTKAVWGFLKRLGADVSDDAVVTGRKSVPAARTASDFYAAITPKQ